MNISDPGYWADYRGDREAVAEFREAVRSYMGCRGVVPVTNGTHAIEVALRGMGLRRGDAVVVPDVSFIATATAVANAGLVPVYADVDPAHFGLSLSSLASRCFEGVKAVIAVHFAGAVNREIFQIKDFCSRYGLRLIEDCAQAFTGSAGGTMAGRIGDAGTCSFQSYKIVNAGEGGMITTDDAELAAACEAIADWGTSPAFPEKRFDLADSNFRLGGLQCHHLARQIADIEAIVARRRDRVAELERACARLGIANAFPRPEPEFVDCPFFFIVKSNRKIHRIEPRTEYPMHRSTMVASIIDRFFPDLAQRYRDLNPPELTRRFASHGVVADYDFINISASGRQSAEELLAPYA